ncbi:MAG: hypothetical protein IIZ39_09115, partial [Blautia sp.]|nr:hypothetical protein [Blautia sp.]
EGKKTKRGNEKLQKREKADLFSTSVKTVTRGKNPCIIGFPGLSKEEIKGKTVIFHKVVTILWRKRLSPFIVDKVDNSVDNLYLQGLVIHRKCG